jgi:ATP-dependent DNA helicase RecG
VLQALERPLEYLAADDFRRAAETTLPLDAIAARIARARSAADAATAAVLTELDDVVQALQARAGDATPLLRRAHGLVKRLRAAPATSEWRDYGASDRVTPPALAKLAAPVATLRAVGPKRSADLVRFGLATVEDVLFHLPFRYEDRRRVSRMADLMIGVDAGTIGVVRDVRELRIGRGRRPMLEVVLEDGPAALQLVWFNQLAYFKNRFRPGQRLFVHGRIEAAMAGPLRMAHPDVVTLGPTDDAATHAGVVPVYEKPTPWPVSAMRRIVQAAVADHAEAVPAAIPPSIAARQKIIDPARALRYVHEPPPTADLATLDRGDSLPHRSLVFDELFFLQLGLALRRSATAQEPGTAYPASTRLVPALRASLPFRPTRAQERAYGEIAADLAAPHPMRRLLQGDVGSGKTLVALMAALGVVEAGSQAAIMAPTELLAEQHHATLSTLAAPLGISVDLLTGSVKGAARRAVTTAIARGDTAIAVGTHALIQEGVAFRRLGLAVVDEQHRFGVLQRAALQRQADGGGGALDVLVMSATPIPRTLALTLYGDLAVSTLDELPPGRTPIRTELVRDKRRDRMYERIRAEVAAGRQAYVVYPLVEESEKVDLKSATTMVRELADGALRGLRLDLLHGRMKPDEKDAVMRRFTAGDFDVLVSTTVIEVGIDVPNATAIAIEHADRFGLAQLHQLRGRVGRGTHPGYCFLAVPGWMTDETYQRLGVLERTTDGFRIAEADLQQRGPGDFLGTRQAGMPPFRVANLLRDTALLATARDEALAWLAHDPDLSRPESAPVRAVLAHRWAGRLELARVG